jgi:hypothetical protein
VKDRSGLVNVNKATVVKVATNLIVYPGLAFDEKLKLTAKLDIFFYWSLENFNIVILI